MSSALTGDLHVRSALVLTGLLIFGGGLMGWALSQTTLEEAQPNPQVSFMKRNPCPANGNAHGACPGYAINHIKALCAGGLDRPSNLQWLTVAGAKRKERLDAQACRAHRKQKRSPSAG